MAKKTGEKLEKVRDATNPGEIKITVLRLLAGVAKVDLQFDNVNIEDPMSELGMDSLNYIVLILAIENEYDIQFEDEFHEEYRVLTLKILVEEISKLIKHQKELNRKRP